MDVQQLNTAEVFAKSIKQERVKKLRKALITSIIVLGTGTIIAVPVAIHYENNKEYSLSIQSTAEGFNSYVLTIKKGEAVSSIINRLDVFDGHTLLGIFKDSAYTIPYGADEHIKKDSTVYLKYEKWSYSVNMPTSDYYTIDISSELTLDNKIEWNEDFKFKINLKTPYTQSQLTVMVDEEELTSDAYGYYTIPAVTENKTVTISGVELNSYSIGIIPSQVVVKNSAGDDLTSNAYVKYGETLTIFYFESSSCYMTSFKVNGEKFKNGNTLEVTQDLTITYTEQEVQYLTYTENEDQTEVIITGISLEADQTEVVVPRTINGKPVTTISDGAFSNNVEQITTLTIPSSVKTIGNVSNTVVDPSTMQVYGTGLPNLETLVIEEGVESIADFSFVCSPNLIEAYLPNSLSSVGMGAFGMCTSLTEITLPSSLTTVSMGMFAFCSNLKSVTFTGEVTTIDQLAFYGCTSLETINLPNSVTTIEYGAFSGCSSLETINIPNSVTAIGSNTFYNCSSLTEIIIPDSVIEIFSGAFSNCTSLENVSIGSNVVRINHSAFSNCTSLTEITIPKSVEILQEGAFDNCTSLKTISFEEDSQLYCWGHAIAYGCTSLESIELPIVENGSWYILDEDNSGAIITKDAQALSSELLIEYCTENYGYFLCKYINYNGLTYRYTSRYDNDNNYYKIAFITGVDENSSSITIPGEIDEVFVYRTDPTAFENCTNLTTLTLEAKDGYTWQADGEDCSTLTMEEIVAYALAGKFFMQVAIS